jgi:hypothetical protein
MEWRVNGELHREDGPAKITNYTNGRREKWYFHGKLHRVGGPAVVITDTSSHIEQWYFHGVLHREDGPAVRTCEGGYIYEEWRVRGLLHRRDGPAVIGRGENIKHEYYRRGRLHRTDGPSRIVWYGGVIVLREYAFNGRCELKEEFYISGAMRSRVEYIRRVQVAYEDWDVRGNLTYKLANGRLDKYDGGRIVKTEWFHRGRQHRTDGPAVIKYDENNRIICREYRKNGHLHRIGGPAIQGEGECWYRRGELHRTDGPAFNNKWYFRGELHRTDGPADGDDWYFRGKLHRPDGPACKGKYYVHGKLLSPEEYEEAQRPRAFYEVVNILPQPIAEEIWQYFTALGLHDSLSLRLLARLRYAKARASKP